MPLDLNDEAQPFDETVGLVGSTETIGANDVPTDTNEALSSVMELADRIDEPDDMAKMNCEQATYIADKYSATVATLTAVGNDLFSSEGRLVKDFRDALHSRHSKNRIVDSVFCRMKFLPMLHIKLFYELGSVGEPPEPVVILYRRIISTYPRF